MDNTNEQTKEQPATNAGEGVQPATASVVEQAVAERERLEGILADIKAERAANEEILAKQILGGRSEAGIVPAPVVEETPIEYAKRLLNGK